jgi:hypothetical protein
VLISVWLTRRLAPPQADATTERIGQLFRGGDNMLALLGDAESQFTNSQANAVAVRRSLVKERLRRLENAFKLTSHAIMLVIVQSDRDRPELVCLLAQKQVKFTYRLMKVRLRLVYRRYGAGT